MSQEKLIKRFQDSDLPRAQKNLEKVLQANEGGHGYFVGKKVLVIYEVCFKAVVDLIRFISVLLILSWLILLLVQF